MAVEVAGERYLTGLSFNKGGSMDIGGVGITV